MVLEWSKIHDLEVREDYPPAIDALEERLHADPLDTEAVIRLGFNLWYAVVEKDHLPTERYAARFMQLYEEYKDQLSDNADFCWAFGLGMSMFWYYFPPATEELGNALLSRARQLEPFWKRFMRFDNNVWFRLLRRISPRLYCFCRRPLTTAEYTRYLGGRGIFARYYGFH